MSTFTTTSHIKSKVDVSERFDLSKFNPCKVHRRRPTIFEIKWGRNNRDYTAECESEECLVFSDVESKWNRFNPLPLCAECKQAEVEITERGGRLYESLWCAPCKAKLIEVTRGARFQQSEDAAPVEVAPFVLLGAGAGRDEE